MTESPDTHRPQGDDRTEVALPSPGHGIDDGRHGSEDAHGHVHREGGSSRVLMVAVALVAAILLISTMLYQVNYQDVVMVQTFGRLSEPMWGDTSAGLGWKFPPPIQTLVRFDRRVQVFEDKGVELRTADQQNVIVTMYCMWRVAKPQQFRKTLKTFASAQSRLEDRLQHWKSIVIANYPMSALVNTDPAKMKLDKMEVEILSRLQAEALGRYGIEVVDVGFKANELGETISAEVIQQQIQERQKYVQSFTSRGEASAKIIEARARAAEEKIVKFAARKAEDIRTKGYREAVEVFKTFQQAPELAMFLREQLALERSLSQRTHFVLDASVIRALEYFRVSPEELAKQRQAAGEGKAPSGEND